MVTYIRHQSVVDVKYLVIIYFQTSCQYIIHATSYHCCISVSDSYGWYTWAIPVYSSMQMGTRHKTCTSLTHRTSLTLKEIVSYCVIIIQTAVSLEMSYVRLMAAICVNLFLCRYHQTTSIYWRVTQVGDTSLILTYMVSFLIFINYHMAYWCHLNV